MAHHRDRIPVRHAEKASKEWPSEWFYIDNVALPDPVRMGLPEFSSALLKKRHSWRPRNLEEEDNAEVSQLMGKIKMLAQSGLSIIKVMAISIVRGSNHSNTEGFPCGTITGKMTPHVVVGRVRKLPPLWPKYWSNSTKGRRRSSLVSNVEADFPCIILLAG